MSIPIVIRILLNFLQIYLQYTALITEVNLTIDVCVFYAIPTLF